MDESGMGRKSERSRGTYAYPSELRSITQGHTDRGFKDYAKDFDLTDDNLEGRMILDVGISKNNRFAREVRERGIHATIIGISPHQKESAIREMLIAGDPNRPTPKDPRYIEPGENLVVAGIAQMLPIRDSSVDLILARDSVSIYNMDENAPEQTKAWMEEFARVLKSGGEARISPPHRWNEKLPLEEMARTYNLSYEKVPDKYYRFRKGV